MHADKNELFQNLRAIPINCISGITMLQNIHTDSDTEQNIDSPGC